MSAKQYPSRPETLRLIRLQTVDDGGCWIWQNGRSGSRGAPVMRYQGRQSYVRRVVAECVRGEPLQANLMAASRCGNPLCVAPGCLEVVTAKGRNRLANERGAYSRPEKILKTTATKRARSLITEELVGQIRASELGPKAISDQTGVSLSHVKAIRRGDARQSFANPFGQLIGLAVGGSK